MVSTLLLSYIHAQIVSLRTYISFGKFTLLFLVLENFILPLTILANFPPPGGMHFYLLTFVLLLFTVLHVLQRVEMET
jgi:hypothetical protein